MPSGIPVTLGTNIGGAPVRNAVRIFFALGPASGEIRLHYDHRTVAHCLVAIGLVLFDSSIFDCVQKPFRIVRNSFAPGFRLATLFRPHHAAHLVLKTDAPLGSRDECIGELFYQGECKKCEVSLWGYRPEPRDLCGHCEGL